MPVDRSFGLGRVTDGATDAVQQTTQNNAGHRSTGGGERSDSLPPVGGDIVHEALLIRPEVLLDEPSYGVKSAVHADDTDVIGAPRQRRGPRPAIARWIVDVVIGPVDALLRVPADKVQTGREHLLAAEHSLRRSSRDVYYRCDWLQRACPVTYLPARHG